MYKKKEDLKLNKKQLIMHDLVNKPFFFCNRGLKFNISSYIRNERIFT